jgi:cell wall-associated NlpC family hydrolase
MTDEETKMVQEIRSWIGTKWKHNVALKGWGTDCIQFIVKIGKEFDWIPDDYDTGKYHAGWALHNTRSILLEGIQELCEQVNDDQYQIGDIFVYVYGKAATHAGIYIGNGVIVHAHIKHGVIDTPIKDMDGVLDSVWRRKVNG